VLLGCCILVPASLNGSPQLSPSCRQAAERSEKGKSLADREQYTAAIEELRSALALCPEARDAALALAQAYLGARQFAAAEKTAKDLLAQDARSESAKFLLADSYFMQQRFQEAGQTLQELLAQDNANADAHKLMGLTLFFYKQDVLAEHELATALHFRPKDEEALYYLGRVYYTQNNFAPAVSAFRQLIALNPNSYKAYDNLALCYEAIGKPEEAIDAFKEAQELARQQDPAYDWSYANLADLLINEDRPIEALPYAREALRINPASARNQYLVGKALSRSGDVQASLPFLRKAAGLDPNYPEPHYLLGQLYRKLSRTSEAEHEFALFQEISRRSSHANR